MLLSPRGVHKRHRTLPAQLAVLSGALLLAGCGGGGAARFQIAIPPESPYASTTLDQYDAALRHYAVAADTTVLDLMAKAARGDSLVRLLNSGLMLHRLGRYEESNTILQASTGLAEERYTKSITQNLTAFMVNDLTIDYTPSALERTMIHYYGMLNYLALGDLDGALVEARAANGFLNRYHRDNEGRRSYVNDAAIQYVAGMLHIQGNDLNDALVSMRYADSAFGFSQVRYGINAPPVFGNDLMYLASFMGVDEVVQSVQDNQGLELNAANAPSFVSGATTHGELLVVIENGFIAHRVEEKVYVPIFEAEKSALGSGQPDEILVAAGLVLARTIGWMNQATKEGRRYWQEHEGGVLLASALLDADLLTLAWPSFDLDGHQVRRISVAAGGLRQEAALFEDLSAVAARDFEENKSGLLTRMVARGLFKYFATQKAAQAGERRGGIFGRFVAKTVASTVGAILERADTRSWSLLPGELRMARFTLPVGERRVIVTVDRGAEGMRDIDLGTVDIRPGQIALRSVFVTGDDPGNVQRFGAAVAEIDYEVADVTGGSQQN